MTAEDKHDRADRWSESYVADTVIELAYETITPDRKLKDLSGKAVGMWNSRDETSMSSADRRSTNSTIGAHRESSFTRPTRPKGWCASSTNSPQREAIDDFCQNDVPIVFSKAQRSSLRSGHHVQEYAVRRNSKDIPRRHPLVLTNIDEYWTTGLFRAEPKLITRVPFTKLSLYSPVGGGVVASVVTKLNSIPEFIDGGEWIAIPHFLNMSFLVYRTPDSVLDEEIKDPNTWDEVEKPTRVRRRN